MTDAEKLERDRAFYVLADFLAITLSRETRTFRYCWEDQAIRLIQERMAAGDGFTMNLWTHDYVAALPGPVTVEFNDEAIAREQREAAEN